MGIVFISYKHDDSGFEEELCRWIDEQEGFTGWFDKYIIGGEEWEPAIDNHIKQAVCVVVIVTPAALNSHYITYEWTLALGLGKVVIPLLFSGFDEKLLHPKLKSRQWVNFTNPEEKQWDELLAGLQKAQNENSLSPYVENALIISQNSVNPQEWRNAMKNLHDDTSLQSTKGLESLINHTLPEKSIEAAWLLAQKTNYQSEAPIDGLQKGLDPKYNKFDDCVEALGRIGGDNAGKYLLDALNQATDDRARQPILIKAIGRSKYRGAVQNLHSTLSMNDIHINTRHAILEALGNIGDKGSFEILKNIVQDANQERVVRILATQALGKNEDPRVADVLIPIIDRYKQYLSDDERQVVHKAIEAVIALNTDAGNTQLQKCLQWSDFAPWRQMVESHLTAQGISL